MKILHTADWHIGKRLHHYDLHQDFELFSQWLLKLIADREVDLLLVSGDIFDLANPSSTARQQYYSLLVKLNQLQCKVILTGGNHDSPAVMNAPKEVLHAIDIQVVGSLPNRQEDYVIPVKNKEGEIEVVVHAIPFLRDADLRNANDGVGYKDRIKAVQDGIEQVFTASAQYGEMQYPNVPHIAMGHLFTSGVATSESEREIQVGNEAQFDANRLGSTFDYVALGHIHKPQKVNANVPTYYSGSPIPLSFSERSDEKRVLLLDTEKGFEPESIPVPSYRKLLKISGSLVHIQSKLNTLKIDSLLKSLIEVELIEDIYSADVEDAFLQWTQEFKHEKAEIVKTRMMFKDKILGAHELFDTGDDITDLKPIEMFSKLLETQAVSDEDQQALKVAFNELVEQVQNAEQV
ncbi:exonuclease subunit SbcD [Flavobacteriaceae bacterium Ap0902]|nr:exonuclease subunit SbcD [Flavobacteriaceae bacterium Ap0902]